MKYKIIIPILLWSICAISQDECPSIGMNMSSLTTELIDVFKTSRPFFESTYDVWDTGNQLPKDEHGYPSLINPGFIARTVFMETVGENYPEGIYTLFYDGSGELDVWGDGYVIERIDNGGTDNILRVDVQPAFGLYLDILSTEPNDPVHNVRVIRPSEGGIDYTEIYQDEYFVPRFYELLKNYSVLRYMDWMATNYSIVESWEQRSKLEDAHWITYEGLRGLPIEVLVHVANQVKRDPWFCMPHKADDDYVRSFATYVNSNLDSDLNVYIEYSNEVWNDFFSDDPYFGWEGQSTYAVEQATANGIIGYFNQIGYWLGRRSGEIWDIWENEFDHDDRLIKVIPIQTGPDLATPITLDYIHNGQAIHQIGDVVACAPYFDGFYESLDLSNITADELLDEIESNQFAFDSGPYWAEQTELLLRSSKYADSELNLIAYEGGQHLWNPFDYSGNDPVTQLIMEVNRHPKMGALYTAYFDWWKNLGGGVFCSFNHIDPYSQYGCWGNLEYLEQDTSTAYKWMATQEWIRDNPCISTSIHEDHTLNMQAIVQPNPSAGPIEIIIPNKQSTSIRIMDSFGREIAFYQNRKGSFNVDKQLISGTYFIQFLDLNSTQKLIIQKP